MYRYSLEKRVFIVKTYWITGSIKNWQRMFGEQFGGKQAPRISPHDRQRERQALDYLYFILSFRVGKFLFANSQNTQPHFLTGMTCKCTALLFFL
jgi:hypothetical protein